MQNRYRMDIFPCTCGMVQAQPPMLATSPGMMLLQRQPPPPSCAEYAGQSTTTANGQFFESLAGDTPQTEVFHA